MKHIERRLLGHLANKIKSIIPIFLGFPAMKYDSAVVTTIKTASSVAVYYKIEDKIEK